MRPSQQKALRIVLESIGNAIDLLRERLEQLTHSANVARDSHREDQKAIVSAIESLRVSDDQRIEDDRTKERRHQENLAEQGKHLSQQKRLTRWTAAAFIAAGIYALIAACQLHEMRQATFAAKESAHAAKRAADTTAEQLDLSERPWIKVAYSLSLPKELVGHVAKPGLTFNVDGSVSLNGIVKATNLGNSVATRLYIRSKLTATPPGPNPNYRLVKDQAAWCEAATQESQSAEFLDSVLPRDSVTESYSVSMDTQGVKGRTLALPNGSKFIEPVVFVCAVYASSFNPKHDSTGAIYLLSPVPIPSHLPETVDGTRIHVSKFVIGGPYYR